MKSRALKFVGRRPVRGAAHQIAPSASLITINNQLDARVLRDTRGVRRGVGQLQQQDRRNALLGGEESNPVLGLLVACFTHRRLQAARSD